MKGEKGGEPTKRRQHPISELPQATIVLPVECKKRVKNLSTSLKTRIREKNYAVAIWETVHRGSFTYIPSPPRPDPPWADVLSNRAAYQVPSEKDYSTNPRIFQQNRQQKGTLIRYSPSAWRMRAPGPQTGMRSRPDRHYNPLYHICLYRQTAVYPPGAHEMVDNQPPPVTPHGVTLFRQLVGQCLGFLGGGAPGRSGP